MILHKSESLLSLSTIKEMPERNVLGLYIRYSGTNAATRDMTLAKLGRIRVNLKGTDIINTTISFFSQLNNHHWGVAEFTNATGGAFAASVYVPFHAPFDHYNGVPFMKEDGGFFELTFPSLTATEIVGGNVEIYYIVAQTVSKYIPLWLQQDMQAGGAGTLVERVQSFNISSLYITDNANISNILVYKDNRVVINANQNTLRSYSHFRNRVESSSGLTMFEIDLNPNDTPVNALSQLLELNIITTGATTVNNTYLAFLFSQQLSQNSFNLERQEIPTIAKQKPNLIVPFEPMQFADQSQL